MAALVTRPAFLGGKGSWLKVAFEPASYATMPNYSGPSRAWRSASAGLPACGEKLLQHWLRRVGIDIENVGMGGPHHHAVDDFPARFGKRHRQARQRGFEFVRRQICRAGRRCPRPQWRQTRRRRAPWRSAHRQAVRRCSAESACRPCRRFAGRCPSPAPKQARSGQEAQARAASGQSSEPISGARCCASQRSQGWTKSSGSRRVTKSPAVGSLAVEAR